MNDLRNPYIAGAPVVEASMFFGREDVFDWIERSLEGKFVDHILVLHGQRRVGKTSVLKQIPNYLPSRYIQVFFDLQGRTNTTLPRFLWWLAREIVRTLQQERGFDFQRPSRASFEDDPDFLINEFLPKLRPILGDQVLLLTFDEFDTLDQPDIQESLAKPLIETLRRLIEFEGLSFIFSIGSSGNKLENMQASYTEFFKSALYRKISFLGQDDCNRLITKPVEGVLTYDPKAIRLIYEITSGHPYFTQLMCHELFSLHQKTGVRAIQPEHVEAILDDVIERGTVNLKFVWDEATDLEKWILASLAQMATGTNTHQLHTNLQGQHIRFAEADIYSAIIRLRDKDILNRDNHFVVHLLLLWLQRNRPLDRVREELLETNPIANRYLEIADTYRDQGQYEKALENYQNVLVEDPKNLKAQVNIGLLHLDGGQFEQAVAAFRTTLERDQEDIAARKGYGDTCLAWGDKLQTEGQTEQAIQCYRDALAINPNHVEVQERLANLYRNQAEAYLSASQDVDALIAYQTALNYQPEDAELTQRVEAVMAEKQETVLASLASQGRAAQESEDWDKAIQIIENALLIARGDKNLQGNLENLNRKRREHLLTVLPHRAEELVKEENWEGAIHTWEAYTSLDPPDLPEAQQSLENARQMKTIQSQYAQALGKIEARDYSQAIELLRKVIQVDPGYKDTSDLLAAAVRASRKKRPNWRRIAWIAAPVLLAAILGLGYLGLRNTGGWEAAQNWLYSIGLSETATIPIETTTPEREATAFPSPTIESKDAQDFADSIFSSIVDIEPTFDEDFSTPKEYWNNIKLNWVPTLSEAVSDGILTLVIQGQGSELQGEGLRLDELSGHDFLLQFDFEPIKVIDRAFIQTRWHLDGDNGYQFRLFMDGFWDISGVQDEVEVTLANGTESIISNQIHTLQTISVGNQMAVYLDGKILATIEVDAQIGQATEIDAFGMELFQVEIDNIKFWKLDEDVLTDQEAEALWSGSGHADTEAEAFRHWDQEEPPVIMAACAKCHSTAGYLDFTGADGSETGVVDTEPLAEENLGIKCIACHPESETTKDRVTMPSGMALAGLGEDANCLECHQGRASSIRIQSEILGAAGVEDIANADPEAVLEGLSFIQIHYAAAAATLYGGEAQGGGEYEGKTYAGKLSHEPPYDTCVGCHDPHSLAVRTQDCTTCHEDSNFYRFGPEADFDEDGDLDEGLYYEIEGLKEILAAELAARQVIYQADTYPYFFDQSGETFSAWSPRLLRAAYNYHYAMKEPGAFAHNGRYMLQLLYDSIEDLNPEAVVNLQRATSREFSEPQSLTPTTIQVFQSIFIDLDWGTNGLIAAIGTENNAVILDASTGEISQDFSDPEQVFRALAWHPNGETLTLGTASGILRFYRFQDTWQGPWDIYTLADHGGINDISFTADGARMAAVVDGNRDQVGVGGYVGIWDTTNNARNFILKHLMHDDAIGVDWMPDGNTFLTAGIGSLRGGLEGIRLNTVDNIDEFTQISDRIRTFDISPDGSYLASYSFSLVQIMTDFEDIQLKIQHGAKINDIAWSPDSHYLATAGVDGILKIWDIPDNLGKSYPDPILTLTAGTEITVVVWSPVGNQLAAGDADGFLWVWDLGDSDS